MNLVDDPSANAVKEALRARLEDWFRIYVDPRRDGIDKGVTGCGQLGRVEDADAAHPMFADRHLSARTGICGSRPTTAGADMTKQATEQGHDKRKRRVRLR